MLIGPSITLEDLEKHMNDKLYEIKMEQPKLQKEFSRLREEFKRIPRTVINENDEEITNPDFVKIPNQMKEIETKIKDGQEQQEFIEKRLEELETIEDRSKGRGNIDKSKEKITLTLNDCLALGIELEAPKK